VYDNRQMNRWDNMYRKINSKKRYKRSLIINNIMENDYDSMCGIADQDMTRLFRESVKASIKEKWDKGLPVARYDMILKKAYLEWPDGRREYI